ncbi:hypothetical protein EG68_00629 [Paragonimus skrjabini miyazakii]|uniref:PH domain-containing protein n=1 Tax=Paragonimus skrjabini miyazakii TaxID=59628 RepID=A0A8S9Z899_9TREM|nr:hypothetical protein EG68_00629 [Paragonimus skrjabini miyazakii]
MRILNPKTVIQFLSYEREEKVGFLWKKRSEHKGSFKKRYFVACGNILAYYEKKLDRDPLGVLILEGHVIEMLDDLTMALRFPTMGESSRSYVLRAESTTEIEQWMRVLSRSGIDFFTLTLEDLDDQLNAVTAVRKSISLGSPDAVSLQQTEAIDRRDMKRSNPFNRTSTGPGVCGQQATALPSNAGLIPTVVGHGLDAVAKSALPQSPTHHLRWLLCQPWEQLHAFARTHLLNSVLPTCEKDLIDLS